MFALRNSSLYYLLHSCAVLPLIAHPHLPLRLLPHFHLNHIPSQPRQIPSVHCIDPALRWTVPFDPCRWFTPCDRRSESGGGIPLCAPLHIHYSAFAPSSSLFSLPSPFPPVSLPPTAFTAATRYRERPSTASTTWGISRPYATHLELYVELHR